MQAGTVPSIASNCLLGNDRWRPRPSRRAPGNALGRDDGKETCARVARLLEGSMLAMGFPSSAGRDAPQQSAEQPVMNIDAA